MDRGCIAYNIIIQRMVMSYAVYIMRRQKPRTVCPVVYVLYVPTAKCVVVL